VSTPLLTRLRPLDVRSVGRPKLRGSERSPARRTSGLADASQKDRAREEGSIGQRRQLARKEPSASYANDTSICCARQLSSFAERNPKPPASTRSRHQPGPIEPTSTTTLWQTGVPPRPRPTDVRGDNAGRRIHRRRRYVTRRAASPAPSNDVRPFEDLPVRTRVREFQDRIDERILVFSVLWTANRSHPPVQDRPADVGDIGAPISDLIHPRGQAP
jgi:hypothetical protein